MQGILIKISLCLFCGLCFVARATHIVGGELYYDYLSTGPDGKNTYRITLKIFRDCGPGTADFDGLNGGTPALLTILGYEGALIGVHDIGSPVITIVPPAINSPCMQVPNVVCVEQGIYTYTISLEPRTGGHWLIYQRCCRNHSIVNLTNPGAQGSTYYNFIPGPELAKKNSSPRFSDYPPVFLCTGFDFSYTQAATDPDGDQLVYKFSSPYQGLDVCCPALGGSSGGNGCSNPTNCPSAAGPPPYMPVNYKSPYSSVNPVAAAPAFAIDAKTGAMSGAPSINGQFVVNVAVEEYRKGVLINVHFRDFQFNMLPCDGVISQFKKQEKCQGTDFTFANTSFNGTGFLWDFGVPGITSDTSRSYNPHYIYPDTGRFVVTLIVNPGDTCTDTSQQEVRVYPPLDVTFQKPERACLAGNNFSFATQGTYGPTTTFRWTFGEKAEPGTSSDRDPENIKYSAPGTYVVWLSARHFSCVDSVMDSLQILPMPYIGIADPGLLCEPATVRFSNSLHSDIPLQHRWFTGNGRSSSAADPEFTYNSAGDYTTVLVGTTFGKCSDTASIEFTVHKKPKAEFDVVPRTVSILEPEVAIKSLVDDAVKHMYVFSDGASAEFVSGHHTFGVEGDFIITQYVTSFFGCMDSTSLIVRVVPEHRIWMPDAFSPDNDLLNDNFGPSVIGATRYSFEIFDRWGHRMFFSADPGESWDGSNNGRPCPQGIYAYRLVYKNAADGNIVNRQGHVTLLRSE